MRSENPRRPARSSRLMALFLVAGMSLTGCSLGTSSKTSGDRSGSGKNEALTVDLPGYPATFDPGLQYDTTSYTVYRNIFDQLLTRDPSSHKVAPGIADSWRQVSPTTWKFTLHQGITFSNGEQLTAEDAAFSINRILNKSFNSPQYANFSAITKASGDGQTLTIETKQPSPTLLSYLTTMSIVPKDYVTKVGDEAFNSKPIGSGPYALASATTGSQMVLKANPHYWKSAPQVTQVTFQAVPNTATRVADLQSGRADIVTQLTPDNATSLKGSGQLQVLATPTERVSYLALNALGDSPTKNAKVRQAIAYAIDYDSIIKNLLRGYANPVKAVLTPLSFGYPADAAGYQYDPAKAKQLLAASGTTDRTIVFPASPAYNQQLVQAIQANLQAVGFTVKITNSDQATYLKNIQSPKHDWGGVRFGRWSCSCLDADGTIYPLFHTGTVWSSYSNTAYDKAVEKARTTADEAQRKAAYAQAFAILQQDVPGIGLSQDYAIYGAAKRVSWKPDPEENFFVADVHLGA